MRSSNTTTRDATMLLAGAVLGATSSFLLIKYLGAHRKKETSSSPIKQEDLPPFAMALSNNPRLHHIRLREWEDMEWRSQSGWHGRDLCHNPDGRAVRVLDYYCDDAKHELYGVVAFGPEAESHRGLCHGGAMSSLMDDFCGHVAFVTSDRPWSGATVQVNVSLKKPVRVGSILRIAGKVSKREGRKVFVEAVLDDGNDDEPTIYAKLDGLSIDGVKMHDEEDAISSRVWETDQCQKSGRKLRRDSSWRIDTKSP